jgi:hypothetical protein
MTVMLSVGSKQDEGILLRTPNKSIVLWNKSCRPVISEENILPVKKILQNKWIN